MTQPLTPEEPVTPDQPLPSEGRAAFTPEQEARVREIVTEAVEAERAALFQMLNRPRL